MRLRSIYRTVIPNYESSTGYASLAIIGILPRVHMYVHTWHTSWKLRSIEEPPAVKPETRVFADVCESAADHLSLHNLTICEILLSVIVRPIKFVIK
ncbi:hypothetical protein G5I_04219 [Acromyrmex echinatior]|uniref:Uncharacterized protein n=1 Tax=Acromyrmex echinatior TaxID=103372 RepID=F4WF13_ACREC|nr:hypothetical protein G5I_04219 [Acromyrmex echinatior]